jgi:UDP-N-acetyl-D-mannosaminuronic acid dehydrogenase
LIELANRHPRVDIMRPGPGVGGHCIAVDPWFVVHSAPSESNLIRTSRMVNDNKPKFIFKKIIDAIKLFEKPLSEINICCLGISYKPDIDDLRESPSIEIIDELVAIKPKNIYIVEPNISLLPNSFDADLVKLKPVEEALRLSDIVIILVLHKEFLLIDRGLLRGKKVIDTIGLMSNECS